MFLRRVSVSNFRKFLSPIVVEGFGDGITVIAGDNEEGKSTLLDAIRAGLFERHNLSGKVVEAMQPFGSSVRPEIRIDFDFNGHSYSIAKTFAQRPSARLITPDGTFEGPEAEECLAKLLSFRVPARGESRPDDRGVLGLFWLEQARDLGKLGLGETGRSTLRTSLEEEVGEVLGGARGRRLLEAARRKRGELLTNIRNQPRARGEYSTSIEAVTTATAEVTRLEQEHREYEDEIDKLTQVRGELNQMETDRVVETAREALASTNERAKALERLRQEDDDANQALALAQARRENANARWTQRQSLIQAVADHERTRNAAKATLNDLGAETEGITARFENAQKVLMDAVDATTQAKERVELAQVRARVAALDQDVAELDRRISEVDKLVSQRAAAEARLGRIRIDRRAFENIQKLERAVREASAGLRAVATRLRFFPTAGQVARRESGQPLAAGESVEITEASRFLLHGFGAVDVEPGASDLPELRGCLQKSQNQLAEALATAGAADLVDATNQLAVRTEAQGEINAATRMIAAHAPDGADKLRAARASKFAEWKRLVEAADVSPVVDLGDLETESSGLDQCKSAEKNARVAFETAQDAYRVHGNNTALGEQALSYAENSFSAAKKDLETARGEISDTDLETALDRARREFSAAKTHKEATGTRLTAADPDTIERQRQRAEDGLRAAEANHRRLSDQAIALENKLIGLGQSGVGELLEEARGREAQAIARRDRLKADAEAWDLLVKTLSSAELDAKSAFLSPVIQRVEPFLNLLLPNASLKFEEETLEITQIARDGREEPYSTLSIGMREQLSILVRLAFAVYLREKGYPAAVILDDALAYADDNRFERMQSALRKAAETVQIVILTCQPRNWQNLPLSIPIKRLTG